MEDLRTTNEGVSSHHHLLARDSGFGSLGLRLSLPYVRVSIKIHTALYLDPLPVIVGYKQYSVRRIILLCNGLITVVTR